MRGTIQKRIYNLKNFKDPARVKIVTVAGTILFSVSAGFLGGWLGAASRDKQSIFQSSSDGQNIVLQESQVISQLAKNVGPSVVSVNVISGGGTTDFFGFGGYAQESAGTGFILTKEGIVVTNRHVVPRGSSEVSITLSDGTELTDVKVIGRTNENDPLDVAFLKINDTKGKDLVPAKIGESKNVQVGDKVIAIGNALGQFQNTVTAGIISGYGRSVTAYDDTGGETLQNLFQTDAAINQGNSGGPLMNINGEVIGINTAVAGNGAENIGFAIPIDDVKGLIASVLEKGKLERPYLGVRYIALTDDIAFQLNIDVKRGAYILPGQNGRQSIVENSPASKADLKEKDIIIKINDESIDESHSLTSLVGKYRVGETIVLTIVREGEEQKVNVVLEAAPQD